MTAFRKVKKSKKDKPSRKRKILKAEDLVPEEPADGKDLGSRSAFSCACFDFRRTVCFSEHLGIWLVFGF